jgi:hypothetical protein
MATANARPVYVMPKDGQTAGAFRALVTRLGANPLKKLAKLLILLI